MPESYPAMEKEQVTVKAKGEGEMENSMDFVTLGE